MMKKDFFDVPRTYYLTSYTRTQVPMFFFNISARYIHYFLDYETAKKKLEGTGLLPCRFFKGKALVSLIFFNYKDVTIGGYDEVTITIMAYPETMEPPKNPLATLLLKKRGDTWGNMGGYVLEMPVTIPAARAAGREIWGYPKFLTRIPFKLEGKIFEFGVDDPETGESIVEVKGEMGPGLTLTGFDIVSLNNYEDSIWQVIIDVDAKVKNCICKRIEVKPGPSKHRMAHNIRDLGFANAKPFIIMSTDNCRAKLNAGRPICSWKTPPIPYKHEDEIAFEKEVIKRSI
ncbi:MAG TPA: acetoacetate decarboxylase family protein [Methanospirillum sp.]|nr:acetoacetate decarboxylase family protein [Methanospirillum sp.]